MKPLLFCYFAFYRGVRCWSLHLPWYSCHVYDAKDGLAFTQHYSHMPKHR